jgi:hypothetical protein
VLGFIEHCGQSYQRVPGDVRRIYNQAWFGWLEIDEDDVTVHVVGDGRSTFGDAQHSYEVTKSIKNRPGGLSGYRVNGRVGVSKVELLVVLTGLSSKHLSRLVNLSRLVPLAYACNPDSEPAVAPLRWRRLQPDEIVAIMKAYRTGSSMADLAKQHGVIRTTISHTLRNAGIPLRRQRRFGTAEVSEAGRLYKQG